MDWRIVTNKEISNTLAKNIEWVHSALYGNEERGLTKEDLGYLAGILKERLYKTAHSIRKVAADIDSEFGFEAGTDYLYSNILSRQNRFI